LRIARIPRGAIPLLFLVVQSASGQTMGAEPMTGTWQMNLAKSTFAAGTASPRSDTYRYENRPDGFTLWTRALVQANGNPGFSFSLRKYDGNHYALYSVATLTALFTTGAAAATTQTSRIIDARNTELFNYTDRVVTQRVTRTLAPDGKSFTQRVYDPAGVLISTTHWDKVEPPPQT
jgi:hypothetical protein